MTSGGFDSAISSLGDAGTAAAGASPTGSIGATPNPGAAMLYFFIVTAVYCILCIFLGSGDGMQKNIMKAAYLVCVMIGEFFINLNLSGSMCGVYQWQSAMFITVIPWLLIFGVIQLFLSMFPGWLSPFSNTFGYLVVKLMGLPDLMKNITVKNTGSSGLDKSEVFRTINELISDPSLLINQFTTEAAVEIKGDDGKTIPIKDINNKETGKFEKQRPMFESAWKNLQESGILKKDEDDKKNKAKFYNFVAMKSTISELVWNLLTGFLVTSVTYNYIINAGCEGSADLMKKKHDAYEAAEKKKALANANYQANQPNYVQSS